MRLLALLFSVLASVGCTATSAQARRLLPGMSYPEVLERMGGCGETRSLVARADQAVRHVVYPGDPRSLDLHLRFQDGKLAGAALKKGAEPYPDAAAELDAWMKDCEPCAGITPAWRGLRPSRFLNALYASQADLEAVEAGMSVEELQSLLGRPEEIRQVGDAEAWEYHRPGDLMGPRVYAIGLKDGRVAWMLAHWHGTPPATPWQRGWHPGTDEALLDYMARRLGAP